MKIGIKSLGCPKNLVDTEVICGNLLKKGHSISEKIENSDIAIINTCSFIKDAVEESIEEILNLVKLKNEGKIKHIIVTGCLPQRYIKDKINEELPEIDAFLGVSELSEINRVIEIILENKKVCMVGETPNYLYSYKTPRILLTPGHYAYIKISEGCDNRCNYCMIPTLRGNYRSRKMEDIIEEVKRLSENRLLREIILIAQDTTLYGYDIYGKYKLAELLKKLSLLKIENLKWIRILYTHPAHYFDELIEVMANYPKICPYLDIPIQHINDKILKKMNRKISKKEIKTIINESRKNIPGLALRTTLMVGFPGETEKDFEELLDYIKEVKFEKLGAFTYSREKGTPAYHFSHQVPKKVKKQRLETLMLAQQKISKENNLSFLGQIKEVLVDELCLKDGRPTAVGRTITDAPEIDGKVFVYTDKARLGEFIKTKITDASEYDLFGEML